MQKKLIALAIAGLASTAAFAQSNVTVYGRVDMGVTRTSGSSGGVTGVSTTALSQGIGAGSRIGFKGAEDLGNGNKAIFEVETGISPDADAAGAGTTAGGLFTGNRHSYLGLTGGWGTFVVGHLDGVRYGTFNKYDAFGGGYMGNFTQMTIHVDRADNAFAYISPKFGGFSLVAAYATHVGPDVGFVNAGTQEAAGNVGDGRLYTISGNYANGPIDLTLGHEEVHEEKGLGREVVVNTLGASYDFGVVKLRALWDSLEIESATGASLLDHEAYFLSASAPIGAKGLLKFTAGRVENKLTSSADSTKVGIGYNHSLSKRTTMYIDYGRISNDSGASRAIAAAANANPTTGGVSGFDIGLAHTF